MSVVLICAVGIRLRKKADQLIGAIVDENEEPVTRYCRVIIGMIKTLM